MLFALGINALWKGMNLTLLLPQLWVNNRAE